MELQDKLLNDMKEAMRSGDKVVLETLRMVRAQLENVRIAKGEDLSVEDVFAVLAKEAKKRKESLEAFEKGGRDDLVQKERRELETITSYLPEPLSESALGEIVSQAIEETGAEGLRDMGRLMGAVMPRIKGRAEGKLVQELVKQRLS